MKQEHFQKGMIVKFINQKGIMDGGTIVSVIKEIDGTYYALLNTLEGERIRVKLDNLIPIKHQRKGVVSEKFKKRIEKEIADYNQQVRTDEGHQEEETEPFFGLSDIQIKLQQDDIEKLKRENKTLREELESIKKSTNVNNLTKTIKALKQSISDGIILSDDKSQALQPLLDLILELNNIK